MIDSELSSGNPRYNTKRICRDWDAPGIEIPNRCG